MAKVKIVQIALALSESERCELFLDDKGRIWYQESVPIGEPNGYRYVWKQLDLPDEPTKEG